MSRRSIRNIAPFTRPVSLLLPALPGRGAVLVSLAALLLAGCGATSTQSPLATTKGTQTADAQVQRGPQLGYVWDSTEKNVYPLMGVAGAAQYGAPVLGAETKYVAGAVGGSAAAEWALLLDSTGTMYVVALPSASQGLGTTNVVATRVPLDAGIAFAPGGAYAVVLSRSANTALVVSGLPGQPLVTGLAAPAGAAWVGAAVSDRGTVLAGWTGTGSGGVQVGVLSAAGGSAVASVAGWGGAGFVPGASTAAGQEQAVVADGVSGQLARVTGIGGAAPAVAALNSGGKLQTPVGVAVSGDGSWAFAADGAKQQVVRVDLVGSTAPVALACGCQPSRLVATPGSTYFELTSALAGQPDWLLDGHATAPRTFFVPALVPGTTAGTTAANASVAAAAPASKPAAVRGSR